MPTSPLSLCLNLNVFSIILDCYVYGLLVLNVLGWSGSVVGVAGYVGCAVLVAGARFEVVNVFVFV